jgi:imidazoleglycerol-phosphate dehydratase
MVDKIEQFMDKAARIGTCHRKTKETDIALSVNLDGEGKSQIDTGIGFFDHMLTAMAVHGSFDLSVAAKGDLEVDGHHTVEDCGICLGQALKDALGDRSGIARFGSMLLPMDEALAQVVLDISGRPFLKYNAVFASPVMGAYDTSLTREFFQAVAASSGMTLHIRLLEGENSHHATEAIFKAFAHALKQAVALSGRDTALSSKGALA